MMRSLLLGVSLPVACLSAMSASAQRPSDVARTRATSTEYGDCVVARYTAIARDVILQEVPNDTIMDDHRRLLSVNCMGQATERDGSGIRFRGDSFRYMLAEGLVRLHYPTGGPTDFSTVPALVRPEIAPLDEAMVAGLSRRRQEEVRENHRVAVGIRTMALLGECVVRYAPEAVRAMALTDPASPEETAAMTAVQPAIAGCLPQGSTVRLNRAVVRGSLLVNYYRLAHAVQPVALSGRD